MFPTEAAMTGTDHHAFFSVEIGSQELFAWGWPQTVILLISASQVASITGMSHQCPLTLCFLTTFHSPEVSLISLNFIALLIIDLAYSVS
jgi:hypothetical protein